MNILVNLGAGWAINLDEWEKKYKEKQAFDKMPYGYCWVEDKDIRVTYLSLNKTEKKMLLNIDILMKIYFYMIKMPFLSFKFDAIWTHNDRETLFYGFLKTLPIFRKLPPIIGNIIWLTDKKINNKKLKKYGKYLNKISNITVLSKAQIEILERDFNINRSKINFVRYGLNEKIYSDKNEKSKPKAIADKKEYILMVGTDIDRDIQMFKQITLNLKEENFIFASNNIEYLNDKYEKNVTTMKCNLKEMKWLYGNSKYIIMPLKENAHASGCTTLIEAGFQGKAIITNSIRGLEDYYLEGTTAEIVDKNDLGAFLEAMKKLENKEYRNKIELSTYDFFMNKNDFTSKTYANEFLKLTKSVI